MKHIIFTMVNENVSGNGGGYYEIHQINFAQNIDHLIYLLDGVILGNIKFNDGDTKLIEVWVSFEDPNFDEHKEKINAYYKNNALFSDVQVLVKKEGEL